MNTKKLISNYKFPYTPMEDDAAILPFYMRNYKETSLAERDLIHILISSDPLYVPVSTLVKIFSEKKSREYIQLFTEFLEKWNINEHHFTEFPKATVFEKIKEVIDGFLTFNPKYVTFELTEDCSVFFQSSVNDKNIYFELFFTNDVKGGVEAVTNIYQEGKTIFAYGGSIKDTFSKIRSKVSQHHWYIEPTTSIYEVPESTFAEATL